VNAQVNVILREKETQESFEKQGAEPMGGSPADFQKMMMRDYEGWKPVVQRSGAASD
jgi:tripartite-type tricarboxylate transporter receptor subunit TctC